MSLHVMYRAHEALDTMLELVSPHQMFIYLFIYLFICYLLIYLLTQVYFLRACKIRRECESGFAFPHGHPVAFGFFQISHSPYSHSIHSFIHSFILLLVISTNSRQNRQYMDSRLEVVTGTSPAVSFMWQGTPCFCFHRSLARRSLALKSEDLAQSGH